MSEFKVGDPDPYPDYPRPTCRARMNPDDGRSILDWICTRPKGHDGDHVAGTGKKVAFTWPKDGA